jgi:PleD family two-component response regulator
VVVTGKPGAFDTASTRVLAILANQAAATLSVIHLKERHREQAARDGLTGLFNRRAFGELLKQTIGREERREGRFALVLIDIDHFKKLNDTYGHPAGDAVLRHTAELLARHTRLGDPAARYGGEAPSRQDRRGGSEAARYGGEEFAVVLVDTSEEDARRTTERIREALARTPVFFEGARITVTASFGIACWPAAGQQPEALISAADRALYAAKESGRNRVVLASSLPPNAA